MISFIPVAAPALVGNEKKYVLDCLDSNWISSNGKYIEQFETGFTDFCGVKHALSCTNGTVALHLALLALGVGPGDEVIVPTLTYIATANAVSYCSAKPVFVDSEPETWNLAPELLEEKISPRTKAIIVVHLYGHPGNMDPIMTLAHKYGISVVEDAAEAHGAEYKGIRVGSIGDIATFSFYGNKIITTGEGGMVTTNDDHLAARVKQLKGQGVDPTQRYWFPIIGYNYRMTNIAAAIGLAQLEKADWHIQRRREVARWYLEELASIEGLQLPVEKSWVKNVYWMFSVVFTDQIDSERDEIIERMKMQGIETRPFFYPMHVLPPYIEIAKGNQFPVADALSTRGINLPSWAGLTRENVKYISNSLIRAIRK
jgi:perosamine synthetase